ncbi:hypothetical protein [Tahibacter caeni]|uniref:hypothetical protein n=1 Tax=Tahibacter caeni TaxID=1453545 RepID=UPI0021488058|nr:hypothetical protein [Tahibacter caeni]
MRPRLVLHLAALVLPLAAVAGSLLVLEGGRFLATADDVRSFAFFTSAAVLAAQIAAALGAPLLLRTDSRWLVPLATGFGMAALTHVLFAPACLLIIGLMGTGITTAGVFQGAPFIVLISVIFVGWISAPLTMAVGVLVNRLQGRELARAG